MSSLISIILPAYNAESCIQSTIQSVLNQTYTDWELIVIDDGSTDNTVAICQQIQASDKRINIFSKPNGGPSSARNLGLQQVHGEYLMFLDADDQFAPNALEIAIQGIEGKELCVFGWKTYPDEKIRHKEIYGDESTIDKEKFYKSLILDPISFGGGFPWNKIWRVPKQGAQTFPRFDEELRLYEDKFWVLKNLDHISSYRFIKNRLYRYRVGESTSHGYTLQMFQNASLAASRIDFYVQSHHPSMRAYSSRLNWLFSLNYAFALLKSNYSISQIKQDPLANQALRWFWPIDVKSAIKLLILRFLDLIG